MTRWLLLFALAAGWAQDEDWERYSEKGGVVSYSRPMDDSNLLAMRGVATADVPFCTIVGAYLDAGKATEWVDMLVQLDEHPIAGTDDAIERQIYDMPWPVGDREFVFKRTTTWDDAAKTVTIAYHSVEDPRFPPTDDTIRAADHGSFFRFTAKDGGRTEVEVVGVVDPKGKLPAWLFNMVQRAWPRESIHGLVEVAKGEGIEPHAHCKDWAPGG